MISEGSCDTEDWSNDGITCVLEQFYWACSRTGDVGTPGLRVSTGLCVCVYISVNVGQSQKDWTSSESLQFPKHTPHLTCATHCLPTKHPAFPLVKVTISLSAVKPFLSNTHTHTSLRAFTLLAWLFCGSEGLSVCLSFYLSVILAVILSADRWLYLCRSVCLSIYCIYWSFCRSVCCSVFAVLSIYCSIPLFCRSFFQSVVLSIALFSHSVLSFINPSTYIFKQSFV